MKISQTYRRIAAYLLAALVFQAVALKELHHLLGHDHEAVAHCETSGNQTHLHSEEYHAESCFLCVYHFAPATLDFHEITIQAPAVPSPRDLFFYQKTLSQWANWHFQLRGPPALAA